MSQDADALSEIYAEMRALAAAADDADAVITLLREIRDLLADRFSETRPEQDTEPAESPVRGCLQRIVVKRGNSILVAGSCARLRELSGAATGDLDTTMIGVGW